MNASNQSLRHLNLQVLRQVKQCLMLAQQHFQRPFAPPTIDYQVRGLKAGVAYLQQNRISLNRTLLMANQQAFIQQTVPHELAHLIVYQVFGKVKPHGKEWQFVMEQLFNCPAQTCHQFDTSQVIGKQFRYQCACQQHQLSIRRHNKIQRGQADYRCKACLGKLVFMGNASEA